MNEDTAIHLLRANSLQEFALGEDSFHGPEHWARVEAFGLYLQKSQPQADQFVIRLFAYLHDSQRQSENSDPQHGRRAAAQIPNLLEKGILPKLTAHQQKTLHIACRDHTHVTYHTCPTIQCCWDADRLDLPRVGIITNPKQLNTPAAKTLAQGKTPWPYT